MTRHEILRLAERVLTLPTAPYHEHQVRDFVTEFCREAGWRTERDRVGNVMVRPRGRGRGAPLVFVAHMDHPGFEMLGGGRAEFLGGVPKRLLAGARVRVYGETGVARVRVTRLLEAGWPHRKRLAVRAESAAGRELIVKGDFGMWDVPAFAVRGDRLHAVAIDDVLSVAVVLALLAELRRRKTRAPVWAVFTRAEEVGFTGAAAAARSGLVPKESLVISVEMSRERPWARIGNGPVVRVGDLATVFDPGAAHFLTETGRGLQRRRRGFRFQRCLMDGGTCEATAFGGFGYRVGGLCLALGNYHNIGPGMRPRPEHVSVRDLEDLLRLMAAAATAWKGFGKVSDGLRGIVTRIQREAPRRLEDYP